MALKQTEDQVKQMRDEGNLSPPRKPAATSSLAKFTSKLATSATGKAAAVTMHPHSHGNHHNTKAPPGMLLSDQDIKAALGLVDESWARQMYRLQQYLTRNWNIKNGVPTELDVDEEQFERSDTATSLGRIVDKVRLERTPTVEKELELGEYGHMYGTVGEGAADNNQHDGSGSGSGSDRDTITSLRGGGSQHQSHLSSVREAPAGELGDSSAFEKELDMKFGQSLAFEGGWEFSRHYGTR
jgi:hypothetical protein